MDFSKMTDFELQKWYSAHIQSEKKKLIEKGTTIPCGGRQSRNNLDFWNVYSYGNDSIKIVYIKVAKKDKKEKPLFNYEDYHILQSEKTDSNTTVSENTDNKKRLANSLSRTRSTVFEIASCNEFQYFCTFTLDKAKRDREDLPLFVKTLAHFIRNKNRARDNNIEYLLIPEEHKQGGWHLHGLIRGIADDELKEFTTEDFIPYKLLEKLKKGEKIYNFCDYSQKFGYCTLTPIKSDEACARYVTKYITKDLNRSIQESGAHLFYASQGLKRRETVLKKCFDKCPVKHWDFENDYVKTVTVKLSDLEKMDAIFRS